MMKQLLFLHALIALLFVTLLTGCGRREDLSELEIPDNILRGLEEMKTPKMTVWTALVNPIDEPDILLTNKPGVYQPTASGRPESALYGTTRTAQRSGRLWPSFHEGVDLASHQRGRGNHPQDPVRSVAAGTVAYACRQAGNSSYGKYVVVEHDDAMGRIYTLYAHLSEVTARDGQSVMPGDVLGVMGNTATYTIPMDRAHLHFEVGVMLNQRFDSWFRGKKLKPSHKAWHGWNLLGLNPYDFLKKQKADPFMTFGGFMAETPVAFECAIRTSRTPDYFKRYPSLWQGPAFSGSWMVVAFSENGVPLTGRNPTGEESTRLTGSCVVLKADAQVIGRNGRRLVVQRNGAWTLGEEGKKHLEMMLY